MPPWLVEVLHVVPGALVALGAILVALRRRPGVSEARVISLMDKRGTAREIFLQNQLADIQVILDDHTKQMKSLEALEHLAGVAWPLVRQVLAERDEHRDRRKAAGEVL